MINFVIQNQWRWNHCKLPIKRNQRQQIHSLKKNQQQQYFYQVINTDDTGPIKQNKIKITLDKSFPFQLDTGFIWHKSWNLPQISIIIQQQEMTLLNQNYKQINCQIMAVYPIKNYNTYYLNEVILQGTCIRTIIQNQVIFKFLKFAQTSFNHSRNKFCLLVWIYGENIYKDKDDLYCLISSPIYVDSRKQARKKQLQTLSTSLLHPPKKFIANIGGLKGSIPNSTEGFINYYSAQNIRNKIKHPFYIAYHFDKVFKLFFNKQYNLPLVETFTMIQSSRSSQPSLKPHQQSILLIQLLEPNQKFRKKMVTILERWKFQLIEYFYLSNSTLQQKWIPITKQQIKLTYKLYYQNQIIKQQQDINAKQQSQNYNNYGINNNYNNNHYKNNNFNSIKNYNQFDDKSNQPIDKEKSYELRTIIDLSRPRKKQKYNKIDQSK